MLMNQVEFWSMNNPVRGFVQDFVEVKKLRKLSKLSKDKDILEIGCGNGHGTKLIQKYFNPKKITAIDLDEKMIEKAKKGTKDISVTFQVADAAKLPFASSSFDAVFDFGIIHHIPNWKDCLKELGRVLKPGGQLILEDLSIETFRTPFGKFLKSILAHPYTSMYKKDDFIDYLKTLDFKVEKYESHYPLGLMKYFVVIAVRL